jgi:hypothetical protein
MTGARRAALRSRGVGSARTRPDALPFLAAARAAVFVALLTVPLNGAPSSNSLCEEFHREAMKMFVEKVLTTEKAEGELRGAGAFETSMLDRVMSRDCDGREAAE